MAVAQGLLAIRSHVDVCEDRLIAVESLLEVKKRVAPYLDLQLVAFPQDGFYRSPTAERNLLRALDMGVEVVGGIPHFERTMAEGAAWFAGSAKSPPTRVSWSTCTVTNQTILCRAISKRLLPKPSGSAWRSGGGFASHLDALDG